MSRGGVIVLGLPEATDGVFLFRVVPGRMRQWRFGSTMIELFLVNLVEQVQ